MKKSLPSGFWLSTISATGWPLCGRLSHECECELVYRFRYYVDDKAFDSEDKKNWYKGTLTGTRNYVLLSMRSVAETMKTSISDGPLYEVVNDKGLTDFLRRFQDMPFAFVRREGKGKTE